MISNNKLLKVLIMSCIAAASGMFVLDVGGQDARAKTVIAQATDTDVTPATPTELDNSGTLVSSKRYAGAAWSPYLVGGLIGVLSMLTFYFSNKPLGASTSYANVAGELGEAIAPQHTRQLPYYSKNKPKVNWQVMLVLGAVIGGFLAALSGGELTGQFLPAMWVDRFGADSWFLRTITALTGGVLMAFGARMAGGCTSGHGISGALQLAIGSWVTAICIFLGGILMAFSVFVWSA